LINERAGDVFKVEETIGDLGGERALVIRAKAMIEKQIALYEDYLMTMKKGNKGMPKGGLGEKGEEGESGTKWDGIRWR
jgi:hypothetical protein